eukprot:SAG31_NODE_27821_length_419_cov_1.287500_2_plen_86_part_00
MESPASPGINQYRTADADDPFGERAFNIEQLTDDQRMLLYLLSKHATTPDEDDENETWIRYQYLIISHNISETSQKFYQKISEKS